MIFRKKGQTGFQQDVYREIKSFVWVFLNFVLRFLWSIGPYDHSTTITHTQSSSSPYQSLALPSFSSSSIYGFFSLCFSSLKRPSLSRDFSPTGFSVITVGSVFDIEIFRSWLCPICFRFWSSLFNSLLFLILRSSFTGSKNFIKRSFSQKPFGFIVSFSLRTTINITRRNSVVYLYANYSCYVITFDRDRDPFMVCEFMEIFVFQHNSRCYFFSDLIFSGIKTVLSV